MTDGELIELTYIKKAIDEVKETLKEFILKEEARIQRVSDLELEMAVLKKECEGCRTGFKKDLIVTQNKISDLEEKPKSTMMAWQGWTAVIVSVGTFLTILIKGFK